MKFFADSRTDVWGCFAVFHFAARREMLYESIFVYFGDYSIRGTAFA